MGLERNNLSAVVEDFGTSYRTGAVDHLEDRLAPDVVWQGVDPDLMCHNRDEVMQVFRSQAKESFRLDQLEVIDGGDMVVLCLRSTDVGDPEQTALIFQVFTFEGDRIVRMQGFRPATTPSGPPAWPIELPGTSAPPPAGPSGRRRRRTPSAPRSCRS